MGGLPGFSSSSGGGGGLPGFTGSSKKKRKKKGRGSWLSRAADVVVDDTKTLAKGVVTETYKTAKAGATAASPFSTTRQRKKALGVLGTQALGIPQGIEAIIPNPERLPYGDVSLVQVDNGKVKFWVRGGEKGDSKVAQDMWTQRPVTSALTALGVLAPAAGGLSIGKLASSIQKANRTMSRSHALKLARRESRNPGYLAAQGIKGGLEPRVLKSKIEGGGTREVELPQARSAIGRKGQGALDAASRKLPAKAPLSERRRANRQLAREVDEQALRDQARAANMMAPVSKVGFTKAGRRKKGDQALLAYALQTPRHGGGSQYSLRPLKGEFYNQNGELFPESVAKISSEHDHLQYKNLYDKNGTLVGTVVYDARPDRKKIYVESIYIDPKHRSIDAFTELTSPLRDGRPLDATFENEKLARLFPALEERARTRPHNRSYDDPFHGPKAVSARFDEILKDGGYMVDLDEGGGRWHALTPSERKRITVERNQINKALANPPDPKKFEAAVGALEQMSKESENIGRYIVQGKANGVDPETAAMLDEIFAQRRDLIAKHLGLDGEARAFFPHWDKFELEQKRVGAGMRPAGEILGRPQERVNMNKNELRLFQSGRLETDPRVLEKTYVSRSRFLSAEEARRGLFDEAVPLDQLTGKERGGYLIRDPDRSPAKLKPGEQAMTDPRQQALDMIEMGQEDKGFQLWRDSWLTDKVDHVPEEWADAPDSVRWIPKDVVDKRIPRRVAVDPDAKVRPLLGTMNALARVATIQGKPARYVTTNTVQNLITATITSPTSALKGARNQAALVRSVKTVDKIWRALRLPDGLRARRPDLYRLVAAQTGDVQATAGLPVIRSANNAIQKGEAKAMQAQHALGETLGSAADTPYRVAVWMNHAKRYGFKTDEQIEKLLADDAPNIARARRQVMQATRDDMYDFNRLSAWERDTISRFFFLWPMVRAGIRYPVTYARDYPVRTGALASLTLDNEPAQDTAARDLFKFPMDGGEYDTGWALPQSISVEQLENLRRVMGGDFYALGSMLSPPLSSTGKALFGYPLPAKERGRRAARNIVPGFATAEDIYREGVGGVPVVKRFRPQPKK